MQMIDGVPIKGWIPEGSFMTFAFALLAQATGGADL
jgi:hypothetical protein